MCLNVFIFHNLLGILKSWRTTLISEYLYSYICFAQTCVNNQHIANLFVNSICRLLCFQTNVADYISSSISFKIDTIYFHYMKHKRLWVYYKIANSRWLVNNFVNIWWWIKMFDMFSVSCLCKGKKWLTS